MKRVERFVRKKGNIIVALIAMISTVAVNGCTRQWYQPEEPEGLEEFGKCRKIACSDLQKCVVSTKGAGKF